MRVTGDAIGKHIESLQIYRFDVEWRYGKTKMNTCSIE